MTDRQKRLYAERDIIEQGEYYTRHVDHMTGEGLHDKSDIAAELAHRDIQITALQTELAEAREAEHYARGVADLAIKHRDISEAAIEAVRERNRWNIEETETGLRICRGDHDRACACEWEYYVPETELAEARETIEAVRGYVYRLRQQVQRALAASETDLVDAQAAYIDAVAAKLLALLPEKPND